MPKKGSATRKGVGARHLPHPARPRWRGGAARVHRCSLQLDSRVGPGGRHSLAASVFKWK